MRGMVFGARMAWVTCRKENGAHVHYILQQIYLLVIIRFCNVDMPVAFSLNAAEDLDIVISYDIVCIWGVHFWDRMEKLPEGWGLQILPDRVKLCIPKFHLWAHKPACHPLFSFNFLFGAGRTHGEIIEENWSDSNRAAAQTKMMGPGNRENTLEAIFHFHNARTVEAFGSL